MASDPIVRILLIAIVGGIMAVWVSHLLRLPAIIFLLGLGILLGQDGLGWMPRPGVHLGRTLPALVGLGVAIILFEGGLSLNLRDLRLAPKAVRNLLSIGALVSFAGATLLAWKVAGLPGEAAALYGALMIVTGPTVVGPLLKSVRATKRVHTVLLWEGILVDAVGALAAVVALEIILEETGVFTSLGGFFAAMLVGPTVGIVGGWLLSKWLLSRIRYEGEDGELERLLILAGALAMYGVSEQLFHESGLGAAIAGGLVCANMMGHRIEALRRFKGTLTTLIIAVLFMLLAADFALANIKPLWPWGFVSIGLLMVVVRPLSVLASTRGSTLTWREKTFLSWIGPRGIVAASVASLFGMLLVEKGQAHIAEGLVSLTFLSVMVTVLLNGVTATPLAAVLGLRAKRPEGVLIVGANRFGIELGHLLETRGIPVLIVDRNPVLCQRVREFGLPIFEGDALSADALEEADLTGIGRVLAVTSNSVVNAQSCLSLGAALDLDPCLFVISGQGRDSKAVQRALEFHKGQQAFANTIDIDSLNILLREGRSRLCMYRASESQGLPFLPLLRIEKGGIELIETGRKMDGEVVGLELKVPEGSPVPFEPIRPDAP